MIIGIRIVVIVLSLLVWRITQKLLSQRNVPIDEVISGTPADTSPAVIVDRLHQLTAHLNQHLHHHQRQANGLLIASSLIIDVLGISLVFWAILGRSFEPFLGLFLVFALRQICQSFCPLPPPIGMIWRSPGVPSLLVTYGTSCDLFFSGHTAIAVYGAATLASEFGTIGLMAGLAIATFEIVAVLILRAHYTMDIFTGIIAALYVQHLAIGYTAVVDGWIAHLARVL